MQTSQKEDVLDTHERILLSERDFAQFVACLEKPEPATPELTAALSEYHNLKAANPEANL